jgi:hypothetical protein
MIAQVCRPGIFGSGTTETIDIETASKGAAMRSPIPRRNKSMLTGRGRG